MTTRGERAVPAGTSIGTRTVEGLRVLTLASDASGGIEVAIATGIGMVGCSLRHRGEELLGLRGGLRRYASSGATMGIPLLHPWANRLARDRFTVGGRTVDVALAEHGPRRDATGLPMHGLLGAAGGWRVDAHGAASGEAFLRASLDFDGDRGRAAAFPFPHRLRYHATLRADTLTIATGIVATGDAAVPISFGYHPYLRLPSIDRAQWVVEIPVAEQLELDERMLPTGRCSAVSVEPGPLGSRTFDDAFRAPLSGVPFALLGGGRRVELALERGYGFAQVYAPHDDDVVAFEPMTAPTNALVDGGADLRLLEPGARYEAVFSIRVVDRSDVGA